MVRRLSNIFGIRTRRQFRLTIRGIAIFTVTISGFIVSIFLQLSMFTAAVLPLCLLLAATMLEFVVADILADQNYPFDTEQKLWLLEKQLGNLAVENITDKLKEIISEFRGCDHSLISGTVHILVDLSPTPEQANRQGLLQLTDYVGRYGGKRGRITTIDQGIIGRCARTHEKEVTNFADHREYTSRMVREFGFTLNQALSHTNIARSYLAQPLMNGSQFIGVVYFFSTEPQIFPHAADRANLIGASRDIVRILSTASII